MRVYCRVAHDNVTANGTETASCRIKPGQATSQRPHVVYIIDPCPGSAISGMCSHGQKQSARQSAAAQSLAHGLIKVCTATASAVQLFFVSDLFPRAEFWGPCASRMRTHPRDVQLPLLLQYKLLKAREGCSGSFWAGERKGSAGLLGEGQALFVAGLARPVGDAQVLGSKGSGVARAGFLTKPRVASEAPCVMIRFRGITGHTWQLPARLPKGFFIPDPLGKRAQGAGRFWAMAWADASTIAKSGSSKLLGETSAKRHGC